MDTAPLSSPPTRDRGVVLCCRPSAEEGLLQNFQPTRFRRGLGNGQTDNLRARWHLVCPIAWAPPGQGRTGQLLPARCSAARATRGVSQCGARAWALPLLRDPVCLHPTSIHPGVREGRTASSLGIRSMVHSLWGPSPPNGWLSCQGLFQGPEPWPVESEPKTPLGNGLTPGSFRSVSWAVVRAGGWENTPERTERVKANVN